MLLHRLLGMARSLIHRLGMRSIMQRHRGVTLYVSLSLFPPPPTFLKGGNQSQAIFCLLHFIAPDIVIQALLYSADRYNDSVANTRLDCPSLPLLLSFALLFSIIFTKVPHPTPFQPWCPYPLNTTTQTGANGQSCFWFSNGCGIGCDECDGNTRG